MTAAKLEFVAVSSPGVDAASSPPSPPPVTDAAADAASRRQQRPAVVATLVSVAPASTLHLAVLTYLRAALPCGWRT